MSILKLCLVRPGLLFCLLQQTVLRLPLLSKMTELRKVATCSLHTKCLTISPFGAQVRDGPHLPTLASELPLRALLAGAAPRREASAAPSDTWSQKAGHATASLFEGPCFPLPSRTFPATQRTRTYSNSFQRGIENHTTCSDHLSQPLTGPEEPSQLHEACF